MLHNDIELFKQVVIATGDAFGINYAIIEKDYYVTEILKIGLRRMKAWK